MNDLDMVIHGEGLRRMRWNSEPLERVLIRANLLGEHLAEWATWDPIAGDLTLVGTNGVAKYRHVAVQEDFLVFERIAWAPIKPTRHGPRCMSLGNDNCDCRETEPQ